MKISNLQFPISRVSDKVSRLPRAYGRFVPFFLLVILVPLSLIIDYRVTLAFIIIGLITFLCFQNPFFGLTLWTILLGFQLETLDWLGFNIAPSDLFVVPLAMVVGSKIFLQKADLVGRSRLKFWILLAFVSFSIGMLTAYQNLGYLPFYTLINKYIGFISLAVGFFVVIGVIDNKERLEKLVRIFLCSGSIINAVVLAFYSLNLFGKESFLSNVVIEGIEPGRLRGFLLDANAYAGFIVPLLLFQISFLISGTSRHRARGILNTLLLSLSLIFTFSRSAWLGFVAGIVFLLLANRNWRGIWIILLPLISGFAILFNLQHFGIDPDFFIFREFTYQARLDLINVGWELYRASPLTGIGLGVFRELYPTIIHNSFIWLLVETGPLGLVALLGLFIRALLNLKGSGTTDQTGIRQGTFAAIGAFIVFALGIEVLNQRHLWLLFAFSEMSRVK